MRVCAGLSTLAEHRRQSLPSGVVRAPQPHVRSARRTMPSTSRTRRTWRPRRRSRRRSTATATAPDHDEGNATHADLLSSAPSDDRRLEAFMIDREGQESSAAREDRRWRGARRRQEGYAERRRRLQTPTAIKVADHPSEAPGHDKPLALRGGIARCRSKSQDLCSGVGDGGGRDRRPLPGARPTKMAASSPSSRASASSG